MISTTGSDIVDTVLGIYTGDRVDDLTVIAAQDDQPDGTPQAAVTFAATTGITYPIAVAGYGEARGMVRISLVSRGAAGGPLTTTSPRTPHDPATGFPAPTRLGKRVTSGIRNLSRPTGSGRILQVSHSTADLRPRHRRQATEASGAERHLVPRRCVNSV